MSVEQIITYLHSKRKPEVIVIPPGVEIVTTFYIPGIGSPAQRRHDVTVMCLSDDSQGAIAQEIDGYTQVNKFTGWYQRRINIQTDEGTNGLIEWHHARDRD